MTSSTASSSSCLGSTTFAPWFSPKPRTFVAPIVAKLLFVQIAQASVERAPVALRKYSKMVGLLAHPNPKSSTRCQFPVTMLDVEL